MPALDPSLFDRVPDAFIIEEMERNVPSERPALRLPLPQPPPPLADEEPEEDPRVIIIDL